MPLIVISNPYPIENEINIIQKLFDAGLERLHWRRPNEDIETTRKYLELLEPYTSKIFLHQNHQLKDEFPIGGLHFSSSGRQLRNFIETSIPCSTSVHSEIEISEISKSHYAYAFFGPVFRSISKKGYHPAMDSSVMKKVFQDSPIPLVAIGGINDENIILIKNWNIYGVAVLGYIWESADPEKNFKKISTIYHSFNSV